ncbi:MAG: hypothetical protein JWO30_1594 [Fibrobacteres bacterium]|nr:hypothetical protein [Fibrobacterota bacterium]
MTIRTKLTTAFFLLLILVGGAFFIAAVKYVTANWKREKANGNLTMALDEAESISNWIRRRTQDVSSLVDYDDFRSNNPKRIETGMRSLRTLLKGAIAGNGFFFLDRQGKILYRDQPSSSNDEEISVAREAIEAVEKTGEPFLQALAISDKTKRAILLIVVPRWSKQGGFLGSMCAVIDLNASRAGIRLTKIGGNRDVSLYLVDSAGTVILASQHAPAMARETQWEEIRRTGKASGIIPAKNALVTFSGVPGFPLWVSMHESYESLNATVRETEHTLGWIGGGGVLIAMVMSLLLSRSVSKPIAQLIRKTSQLKEGAFTPLEGKISGELGNLVKSFNEMATALQKSHRKLSALNELGEAIISDIRLNHILEHVCKRVADTMDVAACSIFLIDSDNVLRLKASTGIAEEDKEKLQFQFGEGIAGTVFRQKKGLIVNDVESDPRSEFIPHHPAAVKLLSIPLLIRDEPRGVMNIQNKKNGDDFTQEDLEILTIFSHQATVSVENFRLFKEVSKELQRVTELQGQLVQSEKLSAIGQLVAGVAHEINNPLGVILGYSELLRKKAVDESSIHSLDIIIQATERAAGIARNLLSFARKQEPKLTLLDVNDVVRSVQELLGNQFMLCNISVFTDLDLKARTVRADIQQLQQVFLNLLTNSMQALNAKKDGRIVIETRQRDGSMTVAISDNGPGIKPEILPRIFEPFFTTKEVGKGTGLGLSICYGIVKEFGGEITINSSLGKGATFVIELPSAEFPAKGKIEPSAAANIATVIPYKVMVVDDEESIRSLLKDLLESYGARVLTAANASAALNLLRSNPVDIIVSDMKMPGMEVSEFYDLCLRDFPQYAKRFIFASGGIVGEDAEMFLERTGCEFINKPFAIRQIIEKVSKVMEMTNKA